MCRIFEGYSLLVLLVCRKLAPKPVPLENHVSLQFRVRTISSQRDRPTRSARRGTLVGSVQERIVHLTETEKIYTF